MRNRVAVELGDDGVADLVGRVAGTVCIVGELLRSDRDIEFRKKMLRVALRQRRVRGSTGGCLVGGGHAAPTVLRAPVGVLAPIATSARRRRLRSGSEQR